MTHLQTSNKNKNNKDEIYSSLDDDIVYVNENTMITGIQEVELEEDTGYEATDGISVHINLDMDIDKLLKEIEEDAKRNGYTIDTTLSPIKSRNILKVMMIVGVAWVTALLGLVVYLYIDYRDVLTIESEVFLGEKADVTTNIIDTGVNKYEFINVDIQPYKDKNKDVVGWLRYKGLDIDIPLVQATDNDLYLERTVELKKSNAGWVFFDFRNNTENLDFHSVIYGHNTSNDTLFGKLKDVLSVQTELEENFEDYKTFQFANSHSSYIFEIVSIYTAEYYDWDYTQIQFNGYEEKQAFVDEVKSRNIIEGLNDSTLSVDDNIFTFSTCHGGAGTTKRLIFHAKLVLSEPLK